MLEAFLAIIQDQDKNQSEERKWGSRRSRITSRQETPTGIR